MNALKVFNSGNGSLIKAVDVGEALGGLARSISCSADGRMVAMAMNKNVHVWGWYKDDLHHQHSLHWPKSPILRVCFSAGSEMLISASQDGSAMLWRKHGSKWSKQQSYHIGAGAIYCALFSSDSNQIAFACEDATVRIQNF